MKFDKDLIIDYVVKGINYEIEKCQSTIRTGEKILAERKEGIFKLGKAKTTNEVHETMAKKNERIKELSKLKDDFVWADELDELELVKNLIKK